MITKTAKVRVGVNTRLNVINFLLKITSADRESNRIVDND